MFYEFHQKNVDSLLGLTNDIATHISRLTVSEGVNKILWNRGDTPIQVVMDGIEVCLNPNQITTATNFHHLSFPSSEHQLSGIVFNKAFYCIIDHDAEIGCNGVLFYGTQDLPIVTIPAEQVSKFEMLWGVMVEEFKTTDNIQGEMLQMLLKRLIIMITRLAKEQLIVKKLDDGQIETIRKFNFLVDMHFRTKRKVSDYAELLYKSPKTLSNLFSTYNQLSPQKVIQNRVVLEAKRLLDFSDKQAQEIAFELGFEDPAHFSRYFKKVAGMTPSEYKEHTPIVN